MRAAGIYVIECLATRRIYVGMSVWIARRWAEHRRELRVGKHHSQLLQRDWDSYGSGAFRWRTIEHLPGDVVVLGSREAHWYSELRPIAAYNMTPIVGRVRVDMSKYEHMDDALTQAYRRPFVAEARRRQPTLI